MEPQAKISKKSIKSTPEALSTLETLIQHGIPCKYVRFHQAVPPALNKEPVGEFRLSAQGDVNRGKLYAVDSIAYTPHGVIFKAYGETNIVPLANIIYVRTIIE